MNTLVEPARKIPNPISAAHAPLVAPGKTNDMKRVFNDPERVKSRQSDFPPARESEIDMVTEGVAVKTVAIVGTPVGAGGKVGGGVGDTEGVVGEGVDLIVGVLVDPSGARYVYH